MNQQLPSKGGFKQSLISDPRDLTINFSDFDELKIKGHELLRCSLMGLFNENHRITQGNIVLCKVENFESSKANLGYVDFKDSNITRSKFEDTSFDFAAFINCSYSDVIFDKCHFHNVSITGCDFYNVRFTNCKLDNMVIESCKFYDCQFTNCSTSNKLFEISLFMNTKFFDTNIQIQTIIDNFGISKPDLLRSQIRDKTINEDYQILELDIGIDNNISLSDIEKFKIEYFIKPEIVIHGSELFDSTFDLNSWLVNTKVPVTFINQINLYFEFLDELYQNNKCTIFPLLKLHSLTNLLTNNKDIKQRFLTPLYGVHLSLSRTTEHFLDICIKYVNDSQQPLIILVNGPLEKEYYNRKLGFLFNHSGIEILEVKKHNSPNELFFSWDNVQNLIPIISLILASRFKVELKKLESNCELVDEKSNSVNLLKLEKSNSIQKFSFELGVDSEKDYLYGLKLKSIFPGDLLLELGLQVSTKRIRVVREIIIDILGKGKSK